MKNIKLVLWLLLLSLSAAWLLADTPIPDPFTYFSFRAVFVQYTGVIGISVMSVAMLLATRPKWMESRLNGLDKMYRLHKWLGITGLLFSVLHWWWAKGTKWMVGWGWLDRPQRKPPSGEMLSQFETWLRSQRGLAESLGEWVFYGMLILIALALIKAVPYRWFRKTHKLLAVVYLVLVYHSLILLKAEYWTQPLGWVMAALMLGGSVAAVLVLVAGVGRKRRISGEIASLDRYPGVGAIEGSIRMDSGWPGHSPGQFAFVTSSNSEGPHPYTIASAWDPAQPNLTFVIKALGDWTARLGDRLKVGMPVSVEGPYGCFDFNDRQSRQIWIGAGIGITPFIAKMRERAKAPGRQKIDLFHTTADYDQAAIDKLKTDAAEADVNLHLTVTTKDPRLTPEHIRKVVPDWRSASVWFCGPTAFGQALRDDFVSHGLSAENYHQELFELR